MFALHPDRSLLNPKFDGYKLDPISSEDTVSRYALQHKATQASVSGRQHFSFQEAQSRIRHNHLSVSPDAEQAVYIDENLRVISIRLDNETLRPSFGVIYDIPQPTQSPASDSRQREYPSSAFLDAQTLLCADGHGTLYILTLPLTSSAELLGFHELPSSLRHSGPGSSLAPFRLHTASFVDGQATAVLSFKYFDEAPPAVSSTRKIPPAEFDVVAVQIPLDTAASNTVARPLDILWHRRGANVPLYLAYEKQRSVFILAGGSPYRRISQPAVVPHEPSNESAPIPSADSPPPPTEPARPPPYAWTQDSEELTLAFPFPSRTTTGDINVLFSPQTLTVLVQGVDFPRYAAALLWGGISPSSSFWTWDAHGAHTYGALTLHIEKQHAGTRWPHVFDASAAQADVAETLDPSELYKIRESLEKYTAELQAAGGGGGRPSLADGEADEEVDSTVGTDTCITWVGADGTDPAWAREDWDVPFTMLSTPLPGSSSEISMVVKHAIDGPRFVLSNEDAPSGRPVWTHMSTYSALAFVLASKRDTRFTYHVPSKAVVAFEGGGGAYGGNLYLYRDAKLKSSSAKQAILRLTENTSGSLLGVGATHVEGKTAILCLCEKELVVLRNVL